jgi:nucleotide-binding universal stress UspA family protein
MKFLLAVDGSRFSLDAVQYLVDKKDAFRDPLQVELVTVHLPVPRPAGMHLVVGNNQIQDYYREEGEASLAKAKIRLEEAGIAYHPHILVGPIAETLNSHANETGCDMIVIGTHGRGAGGRMLLGSIATSVTHLANVPVLLIK